MKEVVSGQLEGPSQSPDLDLIKDLWRDVPDGAAEVLHRGTGQSVTGRWARLVASCGFLWRGLRKNEFIPF